MLSCSAPNLLFIIPHESFQLVIAPTHCEIVRLIVGNDAKDMSIATKGSDPISAIFEIGSDLIIKN
jgi:hypothetical protein